MDNIDDVILNIENLQKQAQELKALNSVTFFVREDRPFLSLSETRRELWVKGFDGQALLYHSQDSIETIQAIADQLNDILSPAIEAARLDKETTIGTLVTAISTSGSSGPVLPIVEGIVGKTLWQSLTDRFKLK